MKFSPAVGAALLLAVVFAVLGPAIRTPWLWDDKTLIRDSPVLSQPQRLGEFLSRDFWAIGANPRAEGMYRPVVTATYFADRAIFGTSSVGPHVVNLVLHLLVAVLIGLLARRLGADDWQALLAAALSALHPVAVEAVANVSSRGDLLATGFLLSALVLLRDDSKLRWAFAAVLVALAQLSKEAAFVALPLAWLVEWCAAGFRVDARRWVRVTAVVAAPSVLVLILRAALLGSPVRLADTSWTPLLSGAAGFLRYLGLLAWPDGLVPYLEPTSPSVLSALVLVALMGAAWWLRRRAPFALFGFAWCAVATMPVAGWLPVKARFSGLLLYGSLVGVGIALAALLQHVRPVVRWALPVVWAVLSVLLVQQWKDDRALWAANIEASPNLAAPRLNLANALSAAHENAAAAEAYQASVELAAKQGDAKSHALAQLGWGNLLLPSDPAGAEPHFRSALETSRGALWQAALNLAVTLAAQRRFAEAEHVLEAQWARTPLPQLADTALKIARENGDDASASRWQARLRR